MKRSLHIGSVCAAAIESNPRRITLRKETCVCSAMFEFPYFANDQQACRRQRESRGMGVGLSVESRISREVVQFVSQKEDYTVMTASIIEVSERG